MGKKIVSTIVDSDENPEIEDLKDKLEVEKAKTTILALKKFEEEKQALLETITDKDKREEVSELIQSGEDLERVRTTMQIIQSGIQYGLSPHDETPKKKFVGQAKLYGSPSNKDVQTWDSVEEMVNDVYDQLESEMFKEAMGVPYDKAKMRKYRSMADKLLSSLITGVRRRGVGSDKFHIQQCRNCGKVLTEHETKCPNCEKIVLSEEGWEYEKGYQ